MCRLRGGGGRSLKGGAQGGRDHVGRSRGGGGRNPWDTGLSRVSNLNLETFNRRWRVPSFFFSESEIHADVCLIHRFLKSWLFSASNIVSFFFLFFLKR